MKYAFIHDQKDHHQVTDLCRILNVSKSGYYSWVDRPYSPSHDENERYGLIIERLFHQFNGIYGSPRITKEMRAMGYQVNKKRVAKIMKERGLYASSPKEFVITTDSSHQKTVAPNLLKQDFSARQPNQKWVGDITYVATDEGWLYVATVIDLFSRRVVGWSMGETLEASLVINAMNMAYLHRRPEPGLIFHSDRGVQYASEVFCQLLQKYGTVRSMSKKGCCYDNAVAESFFRSLKVECVYKSYFSTRERARSAIFEYIETFYNNKRRHSTIGYFCPRDYESMMQSAA